MFQSTSRRLLSTSAPKSTVLHWLDLRGSGLSMLERLSLEEALLRHDDRTWAIVGTHDPIPHMFMQIDEHTSYNPDCMIVMGIGGKPDQLLNIPKVKEDSVMVCKRFSGGGTVVLNASSLWTTFIGRKGDEPHVEPYPREIMEWSADTVFGPTFAKMSESTGGASSEQKTLVLDAKSCSPGENLGKVITTHKSSSSSLGPPPPFALRENDYVLGERKMGGNAQAITSMGWLHHTSFLWDFDEENMDYLTLPSKRPEYRGDRSHSDFLVKLQPYFGKDKNIFFSSLLAACQQTYTVEKVTVPQAMQVIDSLGGMQEWWNKNRTRIVQDF
eukprot:Nitzschia sp. Nitz4//scaffold249_size28687//19131//20114//NITZ4_008118-RA/size28687-processed-gene-0.38-mRNA-1//-1//CDS//3329544020//3609//frame0